MTYLPLFLLKNLGVSLDPTMSLIPHITLTCKAANFKILATGCIPKYQTNEAMQTILHSLVSSTIDYCNSILFSLPKTLLNSLQSCLNSALWLVTHTCKFNHITPVIQHLHLLPIDYHISFKILSMVWGPAWSGPTLYLWLLHPYTPTWSLWSVDKHPLVISCVPTNKFGGRAFESASPTLYNALPFKIKLPPSLSVFKKTPQCPSLFLCFPDQLAPLPHSVLVNSPLMATLTTILWWHDLFIVTPHCITHPNVWFFFIWAVSVVLISWNIHEGCGVTS